MKVWLLLVVAFLLWTGCSSQNACEEPDEIDFGEIVSAEKAKYLENDRVQYRCNPGYVLEGPEWIQCQGQEWTPPPPKCLAPCSITRQQLAAKNLFVFGSPRKARLIQSNQRLQFQCNDGYVLVVPSVRKCIDGYMDFPLCISERGKNCGDPPTIENGDIIPLFEQQYRSGSSVEFRCQKYYAMEGQTRSFCDNGTWTKVPVCLQITCNSPNILNGSFRPQRTIYYDGDLILIRCDSGFIFEPDNGEKVAECTKNGWSPPPKCINTEGGCGPPPAVDNGDIVETLKKNYVESESVTYQCQNFYIMEGSARVTCQNGHWSRAPACRDTEGGCGPPPAVDNGDIVETLKKNYVESESVTYQCQNFYIMEGSARVTCQNGHWSRAPACRDTEGGCGPPPAVDNGDIVESLKENYVESESVTYQCQNLYIMEGSARVTCQNGHWSRAPACRDTEGGCGPPPAVDNGDIVETLKKNYVESESVTYQCQNLYIMEGSARVTCQNGHWSRAPACRDVRCSSPPEIQNGQIIGEIKEKYLPREKVQYRCNTGYTHLRSPFITCSKNGWTQTPNCTDIGENCGRPPHVENGDITDLSKPIYLHSERVIYQCQNFYTIEGSPNVTCQKGRWSQTPTCRAACTVSKEDMREHNIRLKWRYGDKIYSEDGNTVEFVCLIGYKQHPNTRSLRVNCVDGKFDYPYCIPI
ncbi:complement factor H-like isoform X3 [Ahaetulla prasina]|uniref:complement factor H-like isoform X3 n=1 Tax=Ahaetulla prasina TaxID=499056 RepID=UPI002647F4B9|nr:complement factor H-like isoform X3 [Ahaetulla prasina]